MKRQKGITLIALVITIIVLLILAGVSISMALGENGILTRAENAVEQHREGEQDEQAKLQNAVEYMDKYGTSGGTSTGGNNTPTELETLASQITSADYGDYADYDIDLGIVTVGQTLEDGTVPKTDWRIFYEDESNIYLIASDYLPASKFPSGVFGADNGKYNGYWATDSTDTSILSTSGTVTTNNNFLFTKLSNVTATNYNYQATATLLDSSKWSGFAKRGYVDDVNTSVIGSPTVEMWMASWNKKYTDTLAFDSNSTGYLIGLSADELGRIITLSSKEGSSDTLYFPHRSSYEDCSGYWLSSPSSYASNFMTHTGAQSIDHCSFNYFEGNCYGVRPIVSLKSGIKAIYNTETEIWELSE